MIKIDDFKALKKALLISAIYVGIGTFSLFGIMTVMPFYNGLFFIGVILCFPVNFFGFAILFTMGHELGLIIVIQFLMFVLLTGLLYNIFKRSDNKTK